MSLELLASVQTGNNATNEENLTEEPLYHLNPVLQPDGSTLITYQPPVEAKKPPPAPTPPPEEWYSIPENPDIFKQPTNKSVSVQSPSADILASSYTQAA